MLKSAVRVDPIPFDLHKAGCDIEPFHYLHDNHSRLAENVRWLNTSLSDSKRVVYTDDGTITYAEFNKNGVVDENKTKNLRYTIMLDKQTLPDNDKFSCLSNGRNGFIAYGCKSGKLGIVKNNLLFQKLEFVEMVYNRKEEVSAIDCTDNIIVSSDQNGVISAAVINEWRNFRHNIGRSDLRATSIHVADHNNFFTGHSHGLVTLWDLRVPFGNVCNWWEYEKPVAKEFHRSGWKPITSIHSRHNFMFVAASSYYPQLHFGDIRMPKDKYDCTLTLRHPVVKAQFHDFRSNIINVITKDGFTELDNHHLESIWWDGTETNVPAWLRGCDYNKVIRASEGLICPIDMDVHGRDIVIMNVGGDMNYIHSQ